MADAGSGERARHMRSRPSLSGLELLAKELGGGEARVVRRLRGGMGAATHVLALADDRRVVLKRYPPGVEAAGLEWERLSYAHAAGLPAPAPVAVDAYGRWFGCPSLVMSFIEGGADLAPRQLDKYLEQVADGIVQIHATPVAAASGALVRPHSMEAWTRPAVIPPGNLSRAVVSRVVDVLAAELPTVPRDDRVLIHGDLHPGNLVWRRGQLQGIVDWSGARIGSRWWELAYFRIELATLINWAAATDLLCRYEELVGCRSEHQPIWDLLHIYDGHVWAHHWLRGFREQGRRDIDVPLMKRRLNQVAVAALGLVGA